MSNVALGCNINVDVPHNHIGERKRRSYEMSLFIVFWNVKLKLLVQIGKMWFPSPKVYIRKASSWLEYCQGYEEIEIKDDTVWCKHPELSLILDFVDKKFLTITGKIWNCQ